MNAVRGRSLHGHLRIVAAVDDRGATYLREQSFRVPLHLSKPHHEGGALVVNMVSPTAGLFDGDEVDVSVTVEAGARVVLTTPSACRIHRARSGMAAVMRNEITVEAGGSAEYFPELIIPQQGARYRQQTTLRVEAGGTLLFFEWLSPGRVASGEVFAYSELTWDTDLWHDGRLIARERYTLAPGGRHHLASLRTLHGGSHYLGCFVVGDLILPQEKIESLGGDDVFLGSGPLATGGWTIKALCRDSLAARRTLGALRETVYQALGRPMPSLRRF